MRREGCAKAALAVAAVLAISCPVALGHAQAGRERAETESGIPGLDWTRVKEDPYYQAFAVCVRAGAGYMELAVLVSARQAAMAERSADAQSAARSYERLGAFCEKEGALFLAADAYEHAAEMLAKSGRDVSGYLKPSELWERNARYWEERGNSGDASWSRRHAELYRLLAGAQPAPSAPR